MEEKDELKLVKRNQYIIMALIAIVLVVLIVIGSGSTSERNHNSESSGGNTTTNPSDGESGSQVNTDYDVSDFKEVSGTDLENESKSSTKVIYVGRSSCGYCTAFLPALKQAQEEFNYQTLYIDIAKIIDFTSQEFKILDQKSYDSIMNLKTTDEYKGYLEENFGATPMTIVMKDKKVIGIQVGYIEYDELKSFLNANGIK